MAHEIASPIRCRICGATFIKPSGMVIGQPTGRLAEFAQKITQHFLQNHPKENGACELQALEYLGMLRLCKFDIPDEELRQQRDFIRWKTHQTTLAGRLADETLGLRAAELAQEFAEICAGADRVDPEDCAQIERRLIETFKGYREVIEEPGRYLPNGQLPPKPGGPPPN